ncbi:hypothetical protein BB560_001709 [Smittium megazygosporum]|uniref:AmmeMemoRadiSam system protein B n=1 Tax=Smittium megazygosporum TaxID=133381 RepID=A0A2T9ZGT6_9FUNG|nr:hypothetical protein BB560_001709 [Smittium megazygosporum]
MQFPYIYKIFESKIDEIKVVPAIVGHLDSCESVYGDIFSKYLGDPENLFVISSDFCHWGSRFQYMFYSTSEKPSENPSFLKSIGYKKAKLQNQKVNISPSCPIYKSIKNLDFEGMSSITSCDPEPFSVYLEKTQNTICGHSPISVLLSSVHSHVLDKKKEKSEKDSEGNLEDPESSEFEFNFIHYSQSSSVVDPTDSSVSYASGILYRNQ